MRPVTAIAIAKSNWSDYSISRTITNSISNRAIPYRITASVASLVNSAYCSAGDYQKNSTYGRHHCQNQFHLHVLSLPHFACIDIRYSASCYYQLIQQEKRPVCCSKHKGRFLSRWQYRSISSDFFAPSSGKRQVVEPTSHQQSFFPSLLESQGTTLASGLAQVQAPPSQSFPQFNILSPEFWLLP